MKTPTAEELVKLPEAERVEVLEKLADVAFPVLLRMKNIQGVNWRDHIKIDYTFSQNGYVGFQALTELGHEICTLLETMRNGLGLGAPSFTMDIV